MQHGLGPLGVEVGLGIALGGVLHIYECSTLGRLGYPEVDAADVFRPPGDTLVGAWGSGHVAGKEHVLVLGRDKG